MAASSFAARRSASEGMLPQGDVPRWRVGLRRKPRVPRWRGGLRRKRRAKSRRRDRQSLPASLKAIATKEVVFHMIGCTLRIVPEGDRAVIGTEEVSASVRRLEELTR